MTRGLRELALLAGLLLGLTGLGLALPGLTEARVVLLGLHVILGLLLAAPVALAARGHAAAMAAAGRGQGGAVGQAITGIGIGVFGTGLLLLVPTLTGSALPPAVGQGHGAAALLFALLSLAHSAAALRRRAPRARRATAMSGLPLVGAALLLSAGGAAAALALRAPDPAPAAAWAGSPLRSAHGGLVPAERLGGSAGCAECHPAIAAQWAESMHRASATDEHVAAGVRWTAREAGPVAAQHCAGCHDPLTQLAGGWDPARVAAEGPPPPHDEGVSCLACHAVTALHLDPLANGSATLSPPPPRLPGALGRLLIHADLRAHADGLLRPELHRDAASCGACHQQHLPGLTSPTEADLEQQYAEWRAGPFSDPAHPDAATCQGCHMPLVEADDPAAVDGKVHSHRMPGANHAHAVKMGHPAQAEAVLATLREGLTLDLRAAPAPGGLEVEATLGAPKVGHRFPSGATDVSEVWIELVVGDPAAPLYVSGALDAAHYLDPDARVWRRTLVDARGLPVDLHELHRVDRAVASRSVPPGGADAVRWTVPLPPDLAGPVPVRARLRLRRANQRWNDWLFNFDGRTVPVTDVLEARVEVDPAGPPGLDPGPGGASGGAPSGLPDNSGTPDGETADPPRPPPPAPPGMVAIAAGPARIGLDDGEPDEGPAFTVDLPAFAIDRAPVTHGQLKAHLAARGAAGPALRLPWADPLSWAGTTAPAVADDAPAVLLTREEAAAVCAARGARLPTEFEWERAARGAAGHRWPWGDAADPPPCPAVDGRDLPPAVGLCPERASPDGVLDLVGGVVEWTSSPYAAYPRAHLHPNANEWVITFDPGAAAVRGSPARALGPATTAAARTGQNPYQRGRVGFRCAVSLEAR